MKRLFLSHYRGDADEVRELATELRLRGLVPWLDKDGGLTIGDENEVEIRRAILEDCFGLLFYATRSAFDRTFIQQVEIPAAVARKESDPSFILFAIPRGIRFSTVHKLSQERFGHDLTRFNARAIGRGDELAARLALVADDVLELALKRAVAQASPRDIVHLQLSTRDDLPVDAADLLHITATRQLGLDPAQPAMWDRLLAGLRSVKRGLARHLGRPRVAMHGSKHLTAAFMFGRVFAPFALHIRQGDSCWRSDAAGDGAPFDVIEDFTGAGTGDLFLEVSTIAVDIGGAVARYGATAGATPTLRLRMRLPAGAGGIDVDNPTAIAMARQVRARVQQALGLHTITRIHLFFAGPQALAALIGHEVRGAPPVQCYEFDGTTYRSSALVPGGSL